MRKDGKRINLKISYSQLFKMLAVFYLQLYFSQFTLPAIKFFSTEQKFLPILNIEQNSGIYNNSLCEKNFQFLFFLINTEEWPKSSSLSLDHGQNFTFFASAAAKVLVAVLLSAHFADAPRYSRFHRWRLALKMDPNPIGDTGRATFRLAAVIIFANCRGQPANAAPIKRLRPKCPPPLSTHSLLIVHFAFPTAFNMERGQGEKMKYILRKRFPSPRDLEKFAISERLKNDRVFFPWLKIIQKLEITLNNFKIIKQRICYEDIRWNLL